MANALFYTSRVTIRVSTLAAASDTTVSIFSAPESVPSGTSLVFNGGGLSAPVTATLTSSITAGDTTINVSALSDQLNAYSVAYYAGDTPVSLTVPIIDSAWAQANRMRFRRSFLQDVERANAFYSPAGRWPGVGWVLVRRKDYDNPNLQDISNQFQYATNLQLQVDDVDPNFSPVTLNNLAIVQARCVTTGVSSDPDAIYLVQLTDGRGIVSSPWMNFPLNAQFNVRAPAYPGDYYFVSKLGSSAWTWDEMVGYIWNQMGEFLGPYPGLPVTPSGTPENFIFPGVPAWDALNKILDLLGMTVAVDLRQSIADGNPYTIVISGATDQNFIDAQSRYATMLEDDYEYIDTGSGRVPRFVTVCFHKRYQYYGTEETVRDDAFQWQTNSVYQVTIDAFGSFGIFENASGRAILWDDFTVQLDIDGNPLAADVTTANSLALDRAAQFYDRIHNGTEGSMRQLYAGTLPFFTGSSCDGVAWYQNWRQNDLPHTGRAGWRTEVIRGYVWPEVREIPADVSLRFGDSN